MFLQQHIPISRASSGCVMQTSDKDIKFSTAASLRVSRDFLHLLRKRQFYWFYYRAWVITHNGSNGYDWQESPALWQRTDVKPPESDLRPTSERNKTEKEEYRQKKLITLISESHFNQLSTDAWVYTVCFFFFYKLQWLSKMQLVGHRNEQARISFYRNGRSVI